MSDKPLTLELPEELIGRAQAAKLDLRQVLIEALETKLPSADDAEIEQILRKRLPEEQVAPALEALHRGERILDLHAGTMQISDDFDDPLDPDEGRAFFQP